MTKHKYQTNAKCNVRKISIARKNDQNHCNIAKMLLIDSEDETKRLLGLFFADL